MTTRANRANLSPKGTTHAPAKPAPKSAKPAPQAPSKSPAKASKPAAPSATKAHHAANQPAKVTAASVSAKLDATKPSGPLGLTPADIRAAQTDPRNQRPAKGLTIPSEADVQAQKVMRAALAGDAAAPLIAVKRMSTAERRYAKSRIDDVIHAKNCAFKREREELNRWGTINRIYSAEIAAGRFTIDMTRVAKSDANTQLGDVVCFTNYPQGLGKHVQSLYDALDARQERMQLEGASLLDEIMLGSPADAIEQIQHFENTKF